MRRHLSPDRDRARLLIADRARGVPPCGRPCPARPRSVRPPAGTGPLSSRLAPLARRSRTHCPWSVARSSKTSPTRVGRSTFGPATRDGSWAPTSTLPKPRWPSWTTSLALAHAEAATMLDPFSERARRRRCCRCMRPGAVTRHSAATASSGSDLTRNSDSTHHPRAARSKPQSSARITFAGSCLVPSSANQPTASLRPTRLRYSLRKLEALEQTIDQGLNGSAASVLIEADTGLGETRHAGRSLQRLLGRRPVWARRCSKIEAHLPYAPAGRGASSCAPRRRRRNNSPAAAR